MLPQGFQAGILDPVFFLSLKIVGFMFANHIHVPRLPTFPQLDGLPTLRKSIPLVLYRNVLLSVLKLHLKVLVWDSSRFPSIRPAIIHCIKTLHSESHVAQCDGYIWLLKSV